MFRRIRFLIFSWLKPWMDSVAIEFKNELVLKAAEIQRRYVESMTAEKLEALRKQPPIGGCSHRKGIGPYTNPSDEMSGGTNRYRIKDFNVAFHTFPDCTQVIRCMRCNEEAWNRHGVKTPNWDAFLALTKESTNTPSQSEIAPIMLAKFGQFLEGPAADEAKWVMSNNAVKVVYQDKLE
jgi:hypothetical protein